MNREDDMADSPERRLFQAQWDDGSLDLVGGVAVLLIGVGYLVEQVLAEVVVVPLALVAWMALRARVIEPRAGHVTLSRPRRERSGRELAGTAGAGAGILVLFVVLALQAGGGDLDLAGWVDGLPALLVALPVVIGGALIRARRFAVYAAVLLFGAVAAVVTGVDPGVPLVVGGAVMAVAGAMLLARFLASTRALEHAE
jgi:hypothetical protein